MNAGWHIHSQGLINLFRLRGSENYATEDGRHLYLLFFNSFVSLQAPIITSRFDLLTPDSSKYNLSEPVWKATSPSRLQYFTRLLITAIHPNIYLFELVFSHTIVRSCAVESEGCWTKPLMPSCWLTQHLSCKTWITSRKQLILLAIRALLLKMKLKPHGLPNTTTKAPIKISTSRWWSIHWFAARSRTESTGGYEYHSLFWSSCNERLLRLLARRSNEHCSWSISFVVWRRSEYWQRKRHFISEHRTINRYRSLSLSFIFGLFCCLEQDRPMTLMISISKNRQKVSYNLVFKEQWLQLTVGHSWS